MSAKVLVVGHNNGVQEMFRKRGYDVIFEGYREASPDLVIFTGGEDVSPSLYGEDRLPKTMTHPKRDEKEKKFFESYRNTPKIGICRGGQFLNVMNGGAMWQHVNNHGNDHYLTDLLFTQKTVKVTSTHHQMMIPHEDGEVLGIAHLATQFLSDPKKKREIPTFDTEVVWYEKSNSLCFQPHPEYTWGKDSGEECRDYFFKLVDFFYS